MSRPLFCVHELLAFELGSPPGPTFAHRVNFTPLLNDLEFGDAEQQNAALAKFLSLLCEEEAFTSTHVPPHAPALFRILHVLAREPLMEEQSALKTSLLQFICSLFTLDHESSRAHLDTLLAFFVQGDSVDRYYILDALEQLAAATDDPASRAAMTASVKSHLYNGADGDAARFAGVEALENALLCGREHCTKLFFDAGAYACVLSALTTPAPDEKLRIAALSCLAHVYAHVQSGGTAPADDDDPALTLTTTTAAITRAAMRCLRDVSADVVLAATGFLHATAEEAEVRAEFADDPAALCALVVALAGKPEGTVGTGPDWLLAKLGEGGGAGDVLLRGAFEALWTAGDADVDVGVKLQVLRALKDTFLDIRVAAFRAGASELILQTLKSDVQRRTSLLVDLDKLMEEEQVIGYFLLQAGSIPVLVDIADDASPTDRPLVLSVLARLLDSYSTGPDDRISQRDTVAAALMDAPTLARIISHLYSQHAATAGASAHLLAEILLEEAGTECWSYDSSSGGKAPPTPFKDTLVTPDLATHTLNLIHAQIAPAPALHLLCQLCWGYARGFSIVQKALAPFIPGADVFFFAALDGEYSGRHAARQRCCIAEAALLAGALPRAFDLLVVEETSDMARRQAAVEGLRVVLCADSADLGLARRNEVLPRLLASLVADRTRASLERVVWMLRLLESEEDQSWLLKWTDLGNENTTEHLLELMHQFPYKTDDDPEDDAKVRQTQKACEELTDLVLDCINKSLPVLAPHCGRLVGALVMRSYEMDNTSSILETLTKLVIADTSNAEPLVSALKQLLSLPTPASIYYFEAWARFSPAMAATVAEAGLAEWLLSIVTLEDEEDERYHTRRTALTALSTLVDATTDETHRRNVVQLFFDNEKAVQVAIDMTTSTDDVYDAFEAAGALGILVKDFPRGVSRLRQDESILTAALRMLDDPEHVPNDPILLIAEICTPGEPRLTELLRSYLDALNLTPGQAVEEPQGKNKKNKKKQKKHIRMDKANTWNRITLLTCASPAARKCVIDAGAIPAAAILLNSPDKRKWEIPLKALAALVEGEPACAQLAGEMLPRCAELLLKDSVPYTQLLFFIRSFIPAHVALVIPSGAIRSLARALGEFPSSFDNQADLIDVLFTLAQTPASRPALISEVRERLTTDNVEMYEQSWGYVYALRRLLEAPGVGPIVVVEAGGVDFVLKMLRSQELTVVVNAANLAACLVLSGLSSVLPSLRDDDAAGLLEHAKSKALELAARMVLDEGMKTGDPSEDAVQLKLEAEVNVALAEKLAKVLEVLRGEVEEFSADYY